MQCPGHTEVVNCAYGQQKDQDETQENSANRQQHQGAGYSGKEADIEDQSSQKAGGENQAFKEGGRHEEARQESGHQTQTCDES
jgi:hypothetical protein